MWQSRQTLIHLAWAQPYALPFLLRTRCWKRRHRGCFMTGNETFMSSQSQWTKSESVTVSCVLYLASHAVVKWKHQLGGQSIVTLFKNNYLVHASLGCMDNMQTRSCKQKSHWLTTGLFTGQCFRNLSSHEVGDFGSMVNQINLTWVPSTLAKNRVRCVLKSMWRNNRAWASVLTAACFARLPAIKCQHLSSYSIQTFAFFGLFPVLDTFLHLKTAPHSS